MVEAGHIDALTLWTDLKQIEPCGTFTSAYSLVRPWPQRKQATNAGSTLEVGVEPCGPAVSRGETASYIASSAAPRDGAWP